MSKWSVHVDDGDMGTHYSRELDELTGEEIDEAVATLVEVLPGLYEGTHITISFTWNDKKDTYTRKEAL